MKNLKSWLQAGDPLAHESSLSPEDVRRMRERVLSAQPERRPRQSRVFLAIAATLVIGTVGAALVTRASLHRSVDVPQEAVTTRNAAPTMRQLQFVAPGGTRLIWTFNPDFSVR